MKPLLIVVALLSMATRSDAQFRVFLLNKVDGTLVKESQLRSPKVAGQSIRFTWRRVQPGQGQFNWSYVDSEIAKAKAAGKLVTLRPMAGVHAPSWVAKPVWSDSYLRSWEAFVREFGRKYDGNSTVWMVHLSGPTDRSAEMHLKRTGANPTPDVVTAVKRAWERSINAYHRAFASPKICLNASNVFTSRDGILEYVAGYAQRVLGDHGSIQNNSLNPRSSPTFKPWAIIRAWDGTKGGQDIPGRPQDVVRSIALLKSWGGDYVEVHPVGFNYLP